MHKAGGRCPGQECGREEWWEQDCGGQERVEEAGVETASQEWRCSTTDGYNDGVEDSTIKPYVLQYLDHLPTPHLPPGIVIPY